MVFCDLCNCNKRDCIYHYKNAPWGEIIKVRRYSNKQNDECSVYKSKDEAAIQNE